MKNKYVILAVLSLVFVLVRLPIALTAVATIYDIRELYIGTIAKELIEGLSLPLFDYQLTHMRGGTLLTGIFTAPFFLLFGQSYFALKLIALLISLAILAVTFLFLWKFFNKKIAVITGALMAISAPLYTMFSLMLYGRNYEAILFTMIALLLFYKIFFQEGSVPDAAHQELSFALFGLVSGLGMYFDYIFAVTLIHCFAFWFIFDRAFFTRRGFRFFLAFFIVGLTPWICYNLTHRFAAVCIDDDYPNVPLRYLFFLNSLPEVGRKLKDLLLDHLPHSLYFKDVKSIPGDVISYAYYSIFLLSFCVVSWLHKKTIWKLVCASIPLRNKRPVPGPLYREVFILLYPVTFSLLHSFSYYIISKKSEYNFFSFYEYTHLIILYPFAFIISAIFLSRLWEWSVGGRKIAASLFVFILFFFVASGLIADYGLAELRTFGRPLAYAGYNYDVLGIVIGERYGHSIPEAARIAENIRQPYRASVFRGIGFNIARRFFRGKEYADIGTCIAGIDKIGSRYRPFALEGFGAFLELQLKGVTRAAAYVNGMDAHYRPYMYRGIGWFTGWRFKDAFSRGIAQIGKVDEEYRPDYCRGLGEMAGMIFGKNKSWCAELFRGVDQKYQAYVFEGVTGNP